MTLAFMLFVIGVAALLLAWRLDRSSSLGAGFALESILAVIGIACLASGALVGLIDLVELSANWTLAGSALLVAAAGFAMINAPGGGPPLANVGMALLGIAAVMLLALGILAFGGIT